MGLQEVEATPRTPAARPPVAGPRGSGPATAVRALVLPPRVGLGDKSRMSREVHVRFCERAGVRFPRATRPSPAQPVWLTRSRQDSECRNGCSSWAWQDTLPMVFKSRIMRHSLLYWQKD